MRGLLVFGKTGQVATALSRIVPDAYFVSRSECDLSQPEAAADLIRKLSPRAIINAAAFTNVDRAETDAHTANMVNGDAPAVMAAEAATLGIPFIHISTEHIFNGDGVHGRKESDTPEPINSYGKSKLLGENGIVAAGGDWKILRTSWVFSASGDNFVKAILRMGNAGNRFPVVADQIGGPTPAHDVALACIEMLKAPPSPSGVYHLSGHHDVSRADFAREIIRQAGLPCLIQPIATADYPTTASRPKNSRLDCDKIRNAFGISRPDWQQGLSRVLRKLL